MKNFYKNCVKISLLSLSIFLFSNLSSAQILSNSTPTNFWNNVRIGGGIGLSFGDGFFSGSLAPMAIYNVNPQFSAGLGLNATFNNQKNRYKSTILGASIITLFNPIHEIQLSAEYEQLNVKRKWDDTNIEDQNYWYPALFIGAGYRSGNITLGIRYDVLYNDNKSIYADAWIPFVRFYF